MQLVERLLSRLWAAGVMLLFAIPAIAAPYHLLLESNANADPGDEVFLLTYDSLSDLQNGDFSFGGFTDIGISPTFSIAGFTFDNGSYHLLLESDANADPGDEVYLLTYNSLSDLQNGDFSFGGFTNIGISPAFSIAGFLAEPANGGGGDGTVPEPGTLALFGVGLAGLAASRRRKQ